MLSPPLVLLAVVVLMLSTRLLWGVRPSTSRALTATLVGVAASAALVIAAGESVTAGWSAVIAVTLIVLAAVTSAQSGHRAALKHRGPATTMRRAWAAVRRRDD